MIDNWDCQWHQSLIHGVSKVSNSETELELKNYIHYRQLTRDKHTTNEGSLPSYSSLRGAAMLTPCCLLLHILGPGCHLCPLPSCLRHRGHAHQGHRGTLVAQPTTPLFFSLKFRTRNAQRGFWDGAVLWPCRPVATSSRLPFQASLLPVTQWGPSRVCWFCFCFFSIFMNKCMNVKGQSGYKQPPSLWIFNSN